MSQTNWRGSVPIVRITVPVSSKNKKVVFGNVRNTNSISNTVSRGKDYKKG